MADKALLRKLTEENLIDGSWDTDRDMLTISFPLEGHTAKTLVNLIRILYCRQELINRSTGYRGFEIGKEMIERLEQEVLESADAVEIILKGTETKGFCISDGKLHFTGFPYEEDPDRVRSYLVLAEKVNQMALTQKWITLTSPDLSNPKYTFRAWLLRLGMAGEEFKTERSILLKKLPGDASFRTPQQRADFFQRLKDKRKKKKEAGSEVLS